MFKTAVSYDDKLLKNKNDSRYLFNEFIVNWSNIVAIIKIKYLSKSKKYVVNYESKITLNKLNKIVKYLKVYPKYNKLCFEYQNVINMLIDSNVFFIIYLDQLIRKLLID